MQNTLVRITESAPIRALQAVVLANFLAKSARSVWKSVALYGLKGSVLRFYKCLLQMIFNVLRKSSIINKIAEKEVQKVVSKIQVYVSVILG